MNILFLTIGRFTNLHEQGIYTDLLKEFNCNNHSIYVVSPVEKKYNTKTRHAVIDGINILNVKTGNITKTNSISKGISMLLIEHVFKKAIFKYFKNVKFDLILYSTPPITFDSIVKVFKKRDNATTYLLLKDIFPQNAIDLGLIKENGLIHKYFRYREIKLYKNSDYIGCMTEKNKWYVLSKNKFLKENKVEVCPNSIKPIVHETIDKTSIRTQYGLPLDKIIIVYGGNLGKPQGIDFLLDYLDLYNYNDNVFFVIVGSGTEYKKVEKFLTEKDLQNVKLVTQLHNTQYNKLVLACDAGLILLDHRFTIPNFPSRILSYMQASIPVIAATDSFTDLRNIIEENGFGLWSQSQKLDDFNNNINRLTNDSLRKEMGKQARIFLEENYHVKLSYNIIMNHFK